MARIADVIIQTALRSADSVYYILWYEMCCDSQLIFLCMVKDNQS